MSNRYTVAVARGWRSFLALTYAAVTPITLLAFVTNVTFAQQIVIDGRTETSLAIDGHVTDVTTETVQGNNAFNSFHRFDVDRGNVVNLHLPGGSTNLINVVRSERTDIHGVLNSIQDGHIGGNVYFANPHGIVVGAGGIVNVGSLVLTTPSQQFADELIPANGIPSNPATEQLLDGTAVHDGNSVI
ncbi:MAG TPA: leukotoxin LktA family filamentous adhesin, partial [Terriglobales bacterium]|nr:leukotoxin LktA family filamentous adhesin [Terriglobales bacterium]